MNTALILSGGTGIRLGLDIPKQYILVGGRSIISYCIEQLSMHDGIDAIRIVAAEEWHETIRQCLREYDRNGKFTGFSVPGENRQMSVFHGLQDIRSENEKDAVVLIHDAARPNLTSGQITECLNALSGHDGVMPVLPMKDTVYLSNEGNRVLELLERDKIFAGQAPEVFRLEPYYAANERLIPEKILQINGSTEPAVLGGLDVVMIPGREDNFKITTGEDLKRFQKIVAEG